MPVTIRNLGNIAQPTATATIRSFIVPPTPLAVVPIVKRNGTAVLLYLVRDEEESGNITRRIGRQLEKEGVAAYANHKKNDSWIFATRQSEMDEYCPEELTRGAKLATAVAKKGPTLAERPTSNPICLICRDHCENEWGNSHGFIAEENVDEDCPPICNSCNEHEVYYRINHPEASVFILPQDVLQRVANQTPCDCCHAGTKDTDFRILHSRASNPVLLEFHNLTFKSGSPECPFKKDEWDKLVATGRKIIFTARIAEMEVALLNIKAAEAECEAEELVAQVAKEPAPAEVKKPSKKERQADSTRGSNAVRDQKKKEREEFEKACEKAALAQLAIKKAADEKKRKAKAAKAKVARASP